MKKPLLFSAPHMYRPDESRMKHYPKTAADLQRVRENFLRDKPANLEFMIRHRYEWMNRFIADTETGAEIGCGPGFSELYIKSPNFILTDIYENPWVKKRVDALHMSFEDSSLDYLVSSNMIHHLARPGRFFRECQRVLRPGGRLIVQEINCSLAMRVILRIMKHEGYSYDVDVFDDNSVCNNPSDPWSANCAIPNLLFDDTAEFERKMPFKIAHHLYTEFLVFPLSGGVIYKSKTANLPRTVLHAIQALDRLMIAVAPRVFPLQRQVVLVCQK